MAEGGDSARVGGVHIDLTLQGAAKVKAEAAQAAEAVASTLAPAVKTADDATKNLEQSSEKAAEAIKEVGTEAERTAEKVERSDKAADGFSKNGLAGMLLKVAALRIGMRELGDVLEIIEKQMHTGGEAAGKIFSEQGLAGAESRMKEIANQSARASSMLLNASDALKNLSTLNISGIVEMFNGPARMVEEQNRLSVLAGKAMRDERKKDEAEASAERDKENAKEIERFEKERHHNQEVQDKKDAAELERYTREQNRVFEGDAKFEFESRKRGEAMAEAFTRVMEQNADRIGQRIAGGIFGTSSAGGASTDVIVGLLGRIEANTNP